MRSWRYRAPRPAWTRGPRKSEGDGFHMSPVSLSHRGGRNTLIEIRHRGTADQCRSLKYAEEGRQAPMANHPAGRHLPRVTRARQKGAPGRCNHAQGMWRSRLFTSGSGGQTLAGSSYCIRQATRHRGHLRVIARANVHPFGHDVTGGRPRPGVASGGGSGHDSKDRGCRVSPRQGQGLPGESGLRPGHKWWGFAPRWPRRHGVGRRWLSGPRWYRTGMRAWRMATDENRGTDLGLPRVTPEARPEA